MSPSHLSALEQIRGFLWLNDSLATSGMPRPEHFAAIRQAGFEIVINLALPTSDDALPNEGALVSGEGMTYVHIPVRFESPQLSDFERFSRFMEASEGRRLFVHCAANMRVSAFLFLHRLERGTASRAEAERDLRRIWNPDGAWLDFINRRLSSLAQVPLA